MQRHVFLTALALFASRLGIVKSFSPSLLVEDNCVRRFRSGIPTTALSETKSGAKEHSLDPPPPSQPSLFSKFLSNLRTAASDGFGTRAKNVASTMAAGDVVVPLCGDLDRRQALAQRGLYAGVEYVICGIDEADDGDGGRTLTSGRIASLRPAYPLRPHLERSDWPVSLPVSEVHLWLPRATYEAGTALGTLALAGAYLAAASVAAAVVRVAVVPSESMEPALMPGDVVLVARSVFTKPRVNDVVFFDPPSELDAAIANSKIGRTAANENVPIASTKGKQFLKRVVGVPGDRVGVSNSNPFVALPCEDDPDTNCLYRIDMTGSYARPEVFAKESWNRVTPTIAFGSEEIVTNEDTTLGEGEYFVAGDNGYRSVDSRVWGPLKEKYLFGTAQWIIYPAKHFGPIQPGPFTVVKELESSAANL